MRPAITTTVISLMLAGTGAHADQTTSSSASSRNRNLELSVEAFRLLKLETLSRAGVPARSVSTADYSVTVALPQTRDAWLRFAYANLVDPHENVALMREEYAFASLTWSNSPGTVHLVDCRISSSARSVNLETDIGSKVNIPVTGGHVMFAVPRAGPARKTRTLTMRRDGNDIAFHGCEITKVP